MAAETPIFMATVFMATESTRLPHAHASRLRRIWLLTRDSVNAWLEHNASSLGASLAYYTLFSIAPILVIAVAVAGYVFGSQAAEGQVLGQMEGLIGSAGADALRGLLTSAQRSEARGLAAVVSVVTLIIGATSVFGELQKTLDQI